MEKIDRLIKEVEIYAKQIIDYNYGNDRQERAVRQLAENILWHINEFKKEKR